MGGKSRLGAVKGMGHPTRRLIVDNRLGRSLIRDWNMNEAPTVAGAYDTVRQSGLGTHAWHYSVNVLISGFRVLEEKGLGGKI